MTRPTAARRLSICALGGLAMLAAGPAAAGYQLSESELGLSCKQLAGRMQLRILQIRDYAQQAPTSGLSRGIHSVVKPLYGGSARGMDPSSDQARDIAMLEAYNTRLVDLRCKSFDLARWLNSRDPKDLPQPTVVAPK